MSLKDKWTLGSGWKVTVAVTTVAAFSGAALASPGIDASSIPPIDLSDPAVIQLEDELGSFDIAPNITVPWDLDSTFASATDDTNDSPVPTTGGIDDSDSPDSIDSIDSIDGIDSPDSIDSSF